MASSTGFILGVGLLAQKGLVGQAASAVGKFVLAAFEVVSVVATKTHVPSKVLGALSDEILEVVEFTSGAVTKVGLLGKLTSAPRVPVRTEEA